MWTYTVVLTPDDNGTILASVPEVPGVHTFGDAAADARARVEDALVTMLRARMQAREAIPAPRRVTRGARVVSLPPLVGLKLSLYEGMRTSGVGKAEVARRLHVHLPQVDRLLDLEHASKLDTVMQALRLVGQDVEVRVRPTRSRSAA